MGKKRLNVGLVAIFLLFLIAAFLLGIDYGRKTAPVKTIKETIEKTQIIKEEAKIEENEVRTKLPAVDADGNGVLTDLTVSVRKGNGLVLVNIDNVLSKVDTQLSARTAAEYASEYTKIDLSDMDVIYDIKADSPVIAGPSAGAAMTIATIAALQNQSLRKETVITGTINDDGTIGLIGGVLAKATAAKENNMSIFLVPETQSSEIIYKEERICRSTAGFQYCKINYLPERIDIGKEVDISVVEVKSIEDALVYFLE